MTPFTFVDVALTPGLSLVPKAMDSERARALVLAIALQESDLTHRRQHGGGPARGYLQFEPAGIRAVLRHRTSRAHAIHACEALDIGPNVDEVYAALEHCDPLAVVFARLLLWTDPDPLPGRHDADVGWTIYQRTWRPGRPRPETWRGCYGVAFDLISPEPEGSATNA
jgi:hypothetical protein